MTRRRRRAVLLAALRPHGRSRLRWEVILTVFDDRACEGMNCVMSSWRTRVFVVNEGRSSLTFARRNRIERYVLYARWRCCCRMQVTGHVVDQPSVPIVCALNFLPGSVAGVVARSSLLSSCIVRSRRAQRHHTDASVMNDRCCWLATVFSSGFTPN
ncbi:hypothetical protein NP493_50g05101 [Ridgeia piscesae]|uniref:Uncharacterized protein n=1 Tax=Ridgeia piscesae TaxID=27915 RepID=A0AAD9UJH2_RIDPI|nr:hypothetical protein NP493_50g05101 [Ridgeia piscesae]